MRSRIFLKLLAAFAIVMVAAAIPIGFYLRRALESSLRQEIERNLKQKTVMFANRVNTQRNTGLQDIVAQEGHAAGARATVVDAAGKVLADSEASAPTMPNLSADPELQAALRGEIGIDYRPSPALGIPILYVAAPVTGGAARLAYPMADTEGASSRFRNAMLAGLAFAFLMAVVFAGIAARYASNSPNAQAGSNAATELPKSIDLDAKGYQEKQHQLETLLNSMQEAVIAIGPDELVQWANLSMEKLVLRRIRLNAPVVETVRDPDFLRAVREASETQKVVTTRATSIIQGHAFDVTAAPLPDGGAVVVLRDLTETERVEKTRRDFIANVSHELRTPLTSIQGYAETLLDTAGESKYSRDFLEIIRKNAARMSRLTEDLLTLARVESGEQRFDIRPVFDYRIAGRGNSELSRSRGSTRY